MNDLTVVVKTILRPEKCRAMLVSLREHFNGPVVVMDDSPIHYPEVGRGLQVTWSRFTEDIGIGACLNSTLEFMVDTPYAALLDDDFLVTEKTDMARWLPFLEHGVYDIIGGGVRKTKGDFLQDYVGTFEWGEDPRTLSIQRMPGIERVTEPIGDLDIVLNFFAASVKTLRDNPWDERFKVFRHEDWFLMAKQNGMRVGYHPGVEVLHDGDTPPHPCKQYRDLRRKRIPYYRKLFCEKWNIRERDLRL